MKVDKTAHQSNNVNQLNQDGSWSPAQPESYYPNLLEKLKCFLGFHAYCCQKHEKEFPRHCFKCENYY